MSSLYGSIFDDKDSGRVFSVSELNSQVRSSLEARFSSVEVEGEISNFHSAASGHWYFTLKDASSQVKAAIYKNRNLRVGFRPENGLQIKVKGKITVYEPRGEYQLLIDSMRPVGEGALKIAFDQVKAKLAAEGLFDADKKRKIPFFPSKVGVVTSPNGAAFFDILTVLGRRTRSVSVILMPALVQGSGAAEQIVAAIENANAFNNRVDERSKIDVLIVGRGGGSAEDLWSFNEEIVARAIRASNIPVISAVGHEVDFSIADLAADVRAATPSAAAEIVAQKEDEIDRFILGSLEQMERILNYRIIRLRQRVHSAVESDRFKNVPSQIASKFRSIDEFRNRMNLAVIRKRSKAHEALSKITAEMSPKGLAAKLADRRSAAALLEKQAVSNINSRVADKKRQLMIAAAKLNVLSPLSILSRGFSLTRDENGQLVRDAATLKIGDQIEVKLEKGSISANVSKVIDEKSG